MYNNELYHFGVKGMKWGVRRYQNKDGSLTPAGKKKYGKVTTTDFGIAKGSRIGTVALEKNIKYKNSPTYAYTNEYDRGVYTGPYGMDLIYFSNKKNKFDGNVYDHQLKTKKDIKVASVETQQKMFDNFYNKNKDKIDSNMEYGYNALMRTPYAQLTKKGSSYDKVKGNSEKMFAIFSTYLDSYLNNLNVDPKMAKRQTLAKDYIRSLKDVGFDALVDMNNKDVYYGAKLPIVIMNGKKFIKETKVTALPYSEVRDEAFWYVGHLKQENKQSDYRNIVDKL